MVFDSIRRKSILEYNYNLPDDAVARYPLAERDNSKLLLWQDHRISDHHFTDLPGLLPEGAMLVFNNTRVIHARLVFYKPSGSRIEVFCLEPAHPSEYSLSFASTTSCSWKCMIGNLKRWKTGSLEMQVPVGEDMVHLSAERLGDLDGGQEVLFSWDNPAITFSEVLEHAGKMPIPPYLHRDSEEIDLRVYQTVYSRIEGSVAAPTAGLHFTPAIFSELAKRKIACRELTLHVGAGTFQPVKSHDLQGHHMHSEHFTVTKEFVEALAAHFGKVIAVGTTSVRTLESLYHIGLKLMAGQENDPGLFRVGQWDPYDRDWQDGLNGNPFEALSDYMKRKGLDHLEATTQVMILPGYRFRVIDGLVTNFHQPQSTLLLLISAMLGDAWREVYEHALNSGYRFLSYGDSNLYLR